MIARWGITAADLGSGAVPLVYGLGEDRGSAYPVFLDEVLYS